MNQIKGSKSEASRQYSMIMMVSWSELYLVTLCVLLIISAIQKKLWPFLYPSKTCIKHTMKSLCTKVSRIWTWSYLSQYPNYILKYFVRKNIWNSSLSLLKWLPPGNTVNDNKTFIFKNKKAIYSHFWIFFKICYQNQYIWWNILTA